MRLIDAYAVRCDRDDFDTYADYIKAFDAINEAPTVDAVPVIRCKDCMFYQTDKGGWCLDHDDDVLWLEDSYCSRAVRKKHEFRK